MVTEFHNIFGHPINTTLQSDIFVKDPKLVHFRISQIEEEIKEFEDAVSKCDNVEIVDAICDTLYFVYGTMVVFGIPYKKYQHQNYSLNNLCDYIDILHNHLSSLKNSFMNNNLMQFIDILYAIEKECYKIGSLINVDVDVCFSEVHRSNMTKVCSTEDDAKKTVSYYLQIYENGDTKYSEPSYRQKENYFVVYDRTTSKILKSINFEKPNLKQFIL